MNKKNNALFQENEQYIQDVFIQMLETKDIQQITVKSICQKVGINRSTFYAHYLDIYDLLDKIEHQFHCEFQTKIKTYYEKSHSQDEKDYLILFLEFLKEHQNFYKNFLKKRTTFPIENGFEILFEKIAKPLFIKKGMTDENEMMYYMVYTQAGFTYIEKRWLENDCQESVEDIARIILRCLKHKES